MKSLLYNFPEKAETRNNPSTSLPLTFFFPSLTLDLKFGALRVHGEKKKDR